MIAAHLSYIKYNGGTCSRRATRKIRMGHQTHSYAAMAEDDIYILRWGNPQWVSELIRKMARTDTVGFTEGSEIDVPGVDRIHTPEARKHQTHQYKFDRMWFRFALWGRLGYNPDIPEDHWKDRFRHDFGPAGGSMYRATVAAGRIAPTITSYHWNYMNGDWYPEGAIGYGTRISNRRASITGSTRCTIRFQRTSSTTPSILLEDVLAQRTLLRPGARRNMSPLEG
jgi:hypothetical protein